MNDPEINFEKVDERINPGDIIPTEEPFKKLMDFLPMPVYLTDSRGVLSYFNREGEKFAGVTPEIGKPDWYTGWKIFAEDGELLTYEQTPMGSALIAGQSVSGEIRIELPNGQQKLVKATCKPLFDSSGKINGVMTAFNEIENKANIRDEIILANSLAPQTRIPTEHLYRMIDEVQDYAIIMLDKDGNILNWNKGAQRIKGYRAEEIIGKNFRQFYLPEDNERMLPSRLINEAETKGRAIHEGWRVRKNGSMFWGSIVITAIHDEMGDVIGFTKVTRDLTDRKASEDKIKNYSTELEFKNKELEQFAYIASHDLQEPLRKIMVFSAMVKDNAGNPEKVSQYTQKIVASAERMSSLVQEVLRYARMNDDALPITVDLNHIFKSALEDYEVAIKEKHANIHADHLPLVKGHEVQLRQLFSNLIGNALKFSASERTPELYIHSEPATHSEIIKIPSLRANVNYNKFVFSDNGQGFSNEFCGRIFKMFQRNDDSREGSGIGLALCQKIINNHHGYILAESELNKGTSVIFYLPIIY